MRTQELLLKRQRLESITKCAQHQLRKWVLTLLLLKKATAREMCAPLQGRIVTMEGTTHTEQGVKVLALSDYGYGYAGGCLGVHCGHYLTPFIIGVNELPEDPDHLKDLTPEQAEENARIQSKQRALERAIRNQKERLHIANQLGDDELITSERLKLRNLQGKMRAYVDQHDFLHRDYSRERLFSTEKHLLKQALTLIRHCIRHRRKNTEN